MEHARPPPELQIEGSPAGRADAWKKWWKQFEVFIKASGVNKEPKDVQASLLVNLIGAEGYEIFSTFTYTKDQSADDLECLKKKFDEHFGTKCNVAMFRFKFFTRNQNAGESISQFVTALKVLSQNCEFELLVDGLIRDRVVCGVSNHVVRDRLLRTDDLTLAKAVQICEAEELSKTEGRQIEEANKTSSQVDALLGRARGSWRQQRGGGASGSGRGARGRDAASASASGSRPADQQRHAERAQCSRCGSVLCEGRGWCPASEATCFVCKNRGHFARKCNNRVSKKVHDINMCQHSEESEDEDVLYVNVLKTETGRLDTQWIETLCINESLEAGLKVKFAVGIDPSAGTSYFFNVPLTTTEATEAGWRVARRPSGPLPELVMYCYSDKVLCAYYDDIGYVAGLQIAINKFSFTNVFDWETRGFQKWNTAVDGSCTTMYTLSQFFVSAESLEKSKEQRLEERDNTRVLQENAVWLTGIDGELLRVSSSEQDIIDEATFTKQSCIPWMGQHWYYNMSSTTPCDAEDMYPWFPMTLDSELIATGFMTFGSLPIGTGRDWFERPAQAEVEVIVPYGPECMYELAGSPGVLTMHVYYTSTPWLITC